MNERGKLSFKANKDIENNEELLKLKKHWESFADKEESDREKYLRELEIQFSMNSFVEDANSKEANEKVTDMFAEKKVDQQEYGIRDKFEDFKNKKLPG